MKQATSVRQRLVVLGVLGALLLNFPLVGLADGRVGGVPVDFLYIFLVWSGLIGLAAWVLKGQRW